MALLNTTEAIVELIPASKFEIQFQHEVKDLLMAQHNLSAGQAASMIHGCEILIQDLFQERATVEEAADRITEACDDTETLL